MLCVRHLVLVFLAFGVATASASEHIPSLQLAQADQAEIAFWNSVKDSQDTDELDGYLQAYPTGQFAPLAKLRLQKLGGRAPDATASPAKEIRASDKQADLPMPELASGEKGYVGATISNVSAKLAKSIGLGNPRGVVVRSVLKSGPASKGGLQKKDIILLVDGHVVSDSNDFVARTKEKRPGETIAFSIRRAGAKEEITFPVGAFGRDNYESAREGSPQEMVRLAGYLDQGNVFKQNHAEARRWYEKACHGDHGGACMVIGLRYAQGILGVSKDIKEAERWFQKSADMGHAGGMFNLGRLYDFVKGHPHDYKVAADWYKKAIDKSSHTGAMNNLALMYQEGRGVEKDHKEHLRLLRQSIRGGQVQANMNLGLAYARGRGVPVDTSIAIKYWLQATKGGWTPGWRFIAYVHLNGTGIKKDKTRAIYYFRKGAAEGDKPSIEELKELGVALHDAEKIQRLLADLGYDPGPIDGKVGAQVQRAIRSFEKDHDPPQTGRASFELQKKLAAVSRKKNKALASSVPSQTKLLELENLD